MKLSDQIWQQRQIVAGYKAHCILILVIPFIQKKILTLFVICGQLSPDCFGQIVTL